MGVRKNLGGLRFCIIFVRHFQRCTHSYWGLLKLNPHSLPSGDFLFGDGGIMIGFFSGWSQDIMSVFFMVRGEFSSDTTQLFGKNFRNVKTAQVFTTFYHLLTHIIQDLIRVDFPSYNIKDKVFIVFRKKSPHTFSNQRFCVLFHTEV
jgi:hypothetical protein